MEMGASMLNNVPKLVAKVEAVGALAKSKSKKSKSEVIYLMINPMSPKLAKELMRKKSLKTNLFPSLRMIP